MAGLGLGLGISSGTVSSGDAVTPTPGRNTTFGRLLTQDDDFILTTLLTINEFNFENSFKLSILTLMNTVNSSLYGLGDLTFYNLSYFTKYCLIFFMIVGRIELLTILLLVKKFLFKN